MNFICVCVCVCVCFWNLFVLGGRVDDLLEAKLNASEVSGERHERRVKLLLLLLEHAQARPFVELTW